MTSLWRAILIHNSLESLTLMLNFQRTGSLK